MDSKMVRMLLATIIMFRYNTKVSYDDVIISILENSYIFATVTSENRVYNIRIDTDEDTIDIYY